MHRANIGEHERGYPLIFVIAGGLGGNVGASRGTGGTVRSFNPEIDMYQIPESGMAVQASRGDTAYSVDSHLN